jgi:GGDEF domain-containing protein
LSYMAFAILYSLWGLRLSAQFARDRRLGYLLCLTDLAILLPLLVWGTPVAVQVLLLLLWAAGFLATHASVRNARVAPRVASSRTGTDASAGTHPLEAGPDTPLERAVRVRLSLFRANGTRFALVVLRLLRFDETVSYYGEESSRRVLAAVCRRGLRLLGPDAQHFVLPGGRVAFVFEIEQHRPVGKAHSGDADPIDPPDVESLAMAVGRKACERLVDGHRVECAVGWASAPADGLNADDLMYVGAQSTAAFRRVAGGQVKVSERARVAAG